jgi:sucrose-6-phosphate hydrolase SacC (GH32 family)
MENAFVTGSRVFVVADADDLIACWAFDAGEGATVTENVSGTVTPVTFALGDARYGPDRDPRWVPGVENTGLSFDGYSTTVECDTPAVTTPTSAVTVEAWIVPRSFPESSTPRPAPIYSHHDADADRGVEFGIDGRGRLSFGVGTGRSWHEVSAEEGISEYEWSHVVATFDGASGTLRLHHDGSCLVEASVPDGVSVALPPVPVRLGLNNDPNPVDGLFPRAGFDGVIDDLRVYDTALGADRITDRYEVTLTEQGGTHPSAEYVAVGPDPDRYDADPYRPAYHARPPRHWMNEPHGPLYHESEPGDGQYHLFYQYNPGGPYWGNIHWGHLVSDDLVHWRHLPPALSPTEDLTPDGIWSGGSTLDGDGTPRLVFTGGDMSRTPDQFVVTARPADPGDPDLVDWVSDTSPSITRPRSEGLRPNDFRDPFVWHECSRWYCLVGSGAESGGRVLLYRSPDLETWSFRGSLHGGSRETHPELGAVWELPVLLPLGRPEERTQRTRYTRDELDADKHVLVISPVEGAAEVEVYYWIGDWDPDTGQFSPDHEDPRLFDFGDFHHTGPHGFVDPKTGRSILFSITQDDRRPRQRHDAGWAHNAGLPLHLFLREDGRLGIEPIEEVTALRSELLAGLDGRSLSEGERPLDTIGSDTVEIRARLDSEGADRYGLKLRSDPGGPEETLVYYDRRDEHVYVHREHSSTDPETRAMYGARSRLVHSGPVSVDGPLELRVYLDRSMLEVYVDEHRSVTTRLYPESDTATDVSVWSDGDVRVETISVWDLEGAGNGR